MLDYLREIMQILFSTDFFAQVKLTFVHPTYNAVPIADIQTNLSILMLTL